MSTSSTNFMNTLVNLGFEFRRDEGSFVEDNDLSEGISGDDRFVYQGAEIGICQDSEHYFSIDINLKDDQAIFVGSLPMRKITLPKAKAKNPQPAPPRTNVKMFLETLTEAGFTPVNDERHEEGNRIEDILTVGTAVAKTRKAEIFQHHRDDDGLPIFTVWLHLNSGKVLSLKIPMKDAFVFDEREVA
jgi:hypothetical protein